MSNALSLPLPTTREREALPHFLVISPPKTGSTWLAANLNCHPEIFIPDIKEVDFFNNYLPTKGWAWYAELMRPGLGLKRGDATPNYCLLPPEVLRLARSVMPGLKLIYLIRDPVSRAWSHARHCHRYRQTTFAGYDGPIDRVPDEKWIENFSHHTNLVACQTHQHLQSWLGHFPREQLFIDFYSSIQTAPIALLARLFRFLGVSNISDFSCFPVATKLNEGVSQRLTPALENYLRNLHAPALARLATFLRDTFDLTLPAEWQLSRTASVTTAGTPIAGATAIGTPRAIPSHSALTGDAPAGTTAAGMPFQEFERLRLRKKHTPRPRHKGFFGHNLVHFKGQYFGIAQSAGVIDLRRISDRDMVRLEANGLVFRGQTLEQLKLQVMNKNLGPLYRRQRRPGFLARISQALCRQAIVRQRVNDGEALVPAVSRRAA